MRDKLLTALVCLCLVMQVGVYLRADGIDKTIARGVHVVPALNQPQVLMASWTDAGHVYWEVKTPRNADEPVSDWIARHDEAVTALKALHPPA